MGDKTHNIFAHYLMQKIQILRFIGFQPKNNELSEKHSCPVEQLIFGSFSL